MRFDSFELREFGFHFFGCVDEKTGVRFAEHGGVVVRIAGGDDAVVQRFQRGDGFLFLVRLTQFIAGDAVVRHEQAMAKKRRPVQLFHQRRGELLERVGQNYDLRERAEFVEKFLAAGQGMQRADDFLDLRKRDAVLVEDADAIIHQLVVIRFVARGAAQFGNLGFLGDGDPDFRRQHAFHVQRNDGLFHARSFSKNCGGVEFCARIWLVRGQLRFCAKLVCIQFLD